MFLKDKDSGKWRITREGSDRVSDFADNQRDAEIKAKEFCANSGGGEVRINMAWMERFETAIKLIREKIGFHLGTKNINNLSTSNY